MEPDTSRAGLIGNCDDDFADKHLYILISLNGTPGLMATEIIRLCACRQEWRIEVEVWQEARYLSYTHTSTKRDAMVWWSGIGSNKTVLSNECQSLPPYLNVRRVVGHAPCIQASSQCLNATPVGIVSPDHDPAAAVQVPSKHSKIRRTKQAQRRKMHANTATSPGLKALTRSLSSRHEF